MEARRVLRRKWQSPHAIWLEVAAEAESTQALPDLGFHLRPRSAPAVKAGAAELPAMFFAEARRRSLGDPGEGRLGVAGLLATQLLGRPRPAPCVDANMEGCQAGQRCLGEG